MTRQELDALNPWTKYPNYKDAGYHYYYEDTDLIHPDDKEVIEKYNQGDKPISMFRTLRYQLPYSILIGAVLILLLIAWYLIGLPIGPGGVVTI